MFDQDCSSLREQLEKFKFEEAGKFEITDGRLSVQLNDYWRSAKECGLVYAWLAVDESGEPVEVLYIGKPAERHAPAWGNIGMGSGIQ